MQDRFLFRGERLENNKWYYGSYLYLHNPYKYDWAGNKTKTEEDVHYIIDEKNNVHYAINPKTLGQCTGLKDKNGRLIFEGDIVDNYFNGRTIIKYCEKCKSLQCFNKFFGCLQCNDGYEPYWSYFINSDTLDRTTIVGNIYDNPELLQEKTKWQEV